MTFHNRCVLLAEDDPNDVYLLRYAFDEAAVPIPLIAVNDGQMAVEYLSGTGEYSDRTRFPFPRLLILDLKMPRRNGMEVLQWFKKQESLRCMPVLILSSSAHPDDVEKAYELGANSFVVKPGGISARTALAKMINDFWLTLNEPPRVCR